MSLFENKMMESKLKYFHGVASPALLCHKESVRAFKAPLLAGSLWHRVVGFPARKGSIIGRPCAIKNYRSARNGGIS